MYIVEGNIGVGKSTFLELVKQHAPDIDVVPEPKDNWTSEHYGKSLLENFYQDASRWAYTIETFAMICRSRDHLLQQKHPVKNRLIERSIYSGHYCFAKNDYQNGHLTDLEWDIYHKWVDFVLKEMCKPPQGFIYLRTTPKACFDRVIKRGRKSEKNLSLNYLKQIHEWHEKFLIHKDGLIEDIERVPVLILDCTPEFAEDKDQMSEHMGRLREFLARTLPHNQQKEFPMKHTPSGKGLMA